MAARHLDVRLGAQAEPVGELIFDEAGARQTSVFTYHQSWLDHPKRFALSPGMPLSKAPFHGAKNGRFSCLPLPIEDSSPDSWGRKIIERMVSTKYMTDLDYLLETDDFLRTGALRYFDRAGPKGVALAPPRTEEGQVSVPRLHDLDEIIRQARAFEEDPAGYAERRANLIGGNLLAEAVGSLGGARPKVNARSDDGALHIVKLPKIADDYAMARAEVLALRLACEVGINAAKATVLNTAQQFPVAIVKRFDRVGKGFASRLPFISAQSFLGLTDDGVGNYEGLAMQMRTHCANAAAQIEEIFSILIRNTDDHLRNHGFLMGARGWLLSPAYDINPEHRPGGRMQTAISEIHGDVPSVQAAVEASEFFDMKQADAKTLAGDMARHILARWRPLGAELGMNARDFNTISRSIENDDARLAARM